MVRIIIWLAEAVTISVLAVMLLLIVVIAATLIGFAATETTKRGRR